MENERTFVSVRESMCVCVSERVRVREGERKSVRVCVCEREKSRLFFEILRPTVHTIDASPSGFHDQGGSCFSKEYECQPCRVFCASQLQGVSA